MNDKVFKGVTDTGCSDLEVLVSESSIIFSPCSYDDIPEISITRFKQMVKWVNKQIEANKVKR